MTSFVTSYGTCSGSIKGPAPCQEGIRWFNPRWVRRYMCTPRLTCWCACVERAYFLNITDWVVITCLCVTASADAPIHFKNGPGTPCSPLSTVSTGPSCISVGARVHCLLSCQVYISRSAVLEGETFRPTVRHTSHIHTDSISKLV